MYGGLVVFIDLPVTHGELDTTHLWNPSHYVATMPLTAWVPVVPCQSSSPTSYVHFTDNPEVHSLLFQQGIFVGDLRSEGSKVSNLAEFAWFKMLAESAKRLLRFWKSFLMTPSIVWLWDVTHLTYGDPCVAESFALSAWCTALIWYSSVFQCR